MSLRVSYDFLYCCSTRVYHIPEIKYGDHTSGGQLDNMAHYVISRLMTSVQHITLLNIEDEPNLKPSVASPVVSNGK